MIFPAELKKLPAMLEFIRSHLGSFSDEDIQKIEVACEEALVNIISYAYEGDGEIELAASKDQITIKDWGHPYNPLERLTVVNTEAPAHAREVGGLGVFLILKIVRKIDYRRENEANILELSLG